jgi:hypothetical protein
MKTSAILILGLALSAQDALGCQRIDDFIKDVENGRSEFLFDARFTLVDATENGVRTVRRYSVDMPNLVPPAIMLLEIVDDDTSKPFEAKGTVGRLRVRPHSVGHWIDLSASAVTTDIYDHIHACPKTENEICGGFSIHFEGKDAALDVGFRTYLRDSDSKYAIDEVSVSIRERWCTSPNVFLR